MLFSLDIRIEQPEDRPAGEQVGWVSLRCIPCRGSGGPCHDPPYPGILQGRTSLSMHRNFVDLWEFTKEMVSLLSTQAYPLGSDVFIQLPDHVLFHFENDLTCTAEGKQFTLVSCHIGKVEPLFPDDKLDIVSL
jgi:hypothetical protein